MGLVYNPFTNNLDYVRDAESGGGANLFPGDIITTLNWTDRSPDDFDIFGYTKSFPLNVTNGANHPYGNQVRVPYQHDVRTVDNTFWMFSGCNNAGLTSLVRYYDPKTNSWTSRGNAPITIRSGITLYDSNRDVFYYGMGYTNYNATNYTNRFFVYSPSTNTWMELSPFPESEDATRACAIVEGSYVYVFGGPLRKIYRYDIDTDTWEYLDEYTDGTVQLATKVSDGSIICKKFVNATLRKIIKFRIPDFHNYEEVCSDTSALTNGSDVGSEKFAEFNGLLVMSYVDYSAQYYENPHIIAFDLFNNKYLGTIANKTLACLNTAYGFTSDGTLIAIGGTTFNNQHVWLVKDFGRVARMLIKK